MSDNPNAFKLWFDEALVGRMAARLEGADQPFDRAAFTGQAVAGLHELELKDRVRHLTRALHAHLDPDYPRAITHILSVLPKGKDTTEEVSEGFELWPYCHFVETHGVEHLDVSMHAMYELTQRFSAEFAIRPFLVRYPEAVLAQLEEWTRDPNPHVRRWVSEGTRPRLPWGMRLSAFVDDPSPLLPLLEALRRDPEEYVRRSVANNLNDIAKDHPAVVVAVAKRWSEDADKDEKRMIKHALRTLIKRGDPGALEVLGFAPPLVEVTEFSVATPHVALGGSLEFTLALTSTAPKEQRLLIDYAVHHVKANGSLSPKVFKGTTRTLKPGEVMTLSRKHAMKLITTRRYYPGTHLVEVLVNGEPLGQCEFEFDTK